MSFNKLLLKGYMVAKGYNVKELAGEIGMNEVTLYRKLNTGNFSRNEIIKIAEILDITDINRVFFCKETCG